MEAGKEPTDAVFFPKGVWREDRLRKSASDRKKNGAGATKKKKGGCLTRRTQSKKNRARKTVLICYSKPKQPSRKDSQPERRARAFSTYLPIRSAKKVRRKQLLLWKKRKAQPKRNQPKHTRQPPLTTCERKSKTKRRKELPAEKQTSDTDSNSTKREFPAGGRDQTVEKRRGEKIFFGRRASARVGRVPHGGDY